VLYLQAQANTSLYKTEFASTFKVLWPVLRLQHFKCYEQLFKCQTKCSTLKVLSFQHFTFSSVRKIEINKSCLSAFDDKRYILDDCVHTLVYGHESIARLNARLCTYEGDGSEWTYHVVRLYLLHIPSFCYFYCVYIYDVYMLLLFFVRIVCTLYTCCLRIHTNVFATLIVARCK